MKQALRICHNLGDVELKRNDRLNARRLKQMIRSALDQYRDEERVRASALHEQTRRRHGRDYRTPGYHPRRYGLRAKLTEQTDMRRHHLSEMEHDNRPTGKAEPGCWPRCSSTIAGERYNSEIKE